ncbi:hypothetical protein [Methylobacterium sp. SI9]|uniref:hypothetical protein n=1 Tax=Methylobacterium guangdongense TaxID=3138811 RepID=UPI00313AC4D5
MDDGVELGLCLGVEDRVASQRSLPAGGEVDFYHDLGYVCRAASSLHGCEYPGGQHLEIYVSFRLWIGVCGICADSSRPGIEDVRFQDALNGSSVSALGRKPNGSSGWLAVGPLSRGSRV